MARHSARLMTALLLALGLAAGAHAQVKRDQTVLPVVDHSSGKVQASACGSFSTKLQKAATASALST